MLQRFLLIRHCQAVSQAPQAALTEVGRKQAEALASFLQQKPVDHIVSSSYTRAQQSILPFAQRSGRRVDLDHRLIERCLSDGPVEKWQQAIRKSFEDLNFRLPGGESGQEVQARAWAALNATLKADHVLPVFVTHGNLISLLLNSLDSDFGYQQWESLSNPDVFQLEKHGQGQWQFERIWS